MSDKLEALSQPVAVMYADGYVMTREECGNAFAACCETQSPLYSQEYVTALLAALEEKDQELDKEGDILIDTQESMREWKLRANAAEQREEHLKASVDVLSAKNAELQQRLQQPIKLPPLMPENIFGGTPQAHMVANSHNNAITACSMSIRDAGFKSECTVWKEAKE